MTFEEAHELLNGQEIEKVAAQMRQWHPSILAEMLRAVDLAYHRRWNIFPTVSGFGASHPDWTAAVKEVASNSGFDL